MRNSTNRLINKENIFLSILREDAESVRIYSNSQNFNSGNWKELCEFAIKNKLFPVFYSHLLALELNSIPPEILSRFKNLYFYNLQKNLILQKELFNVLAHFRQAGLPVIPLKGPFFTSYLYEDIALRQASDDLDLLVQQERLKDAENILEMLGYHTNEKRRLGYHKFNRQIPFFRTAANSKAYVVDLHWSLRSRFIRTHTRDFWANAKQVEVSGLQILMPSNEDLLLYLALISMFDGAFIQIKHLYDMHRLIIKFGKEMDWQVTAEKARKFNLDAALFFALRLTQGFFRTGLSKELLNTIKPNYIKENLLRLWVNEKNVLRFRGKIASSYTWYYLTSSYFNSNSIFDCISIIYKKIFISPEEVAWKCKLPLSKISYSLYIKRLLKPFKRFFKRKSG